MTTSVKTSSSEAVAKGAALVLMVLCAAQFIMILDSAVMNVSIATVAADLGTTVTGIQTAITLYMLVMASLMITGGKIGGIIGRRRAFGLGLVIYSIGSFTTAISPNLTVLLIGWSFLEGMGAALILPAIVALVAGNFPTERRTAAYGMVASAGAIAVAAGPLIGGAVTTLFSWRWVFVGEVIVCMIILAVVRKVHDTPMTKQPPIDVLGAIMSIIGLSLVVLGVLKSAEWGWVQPKPEAPALFGVSLTTWFILGGFFVLWLFTQWEARMERLGKEPLLRMELLHVPQLSGGLFMFFFQFLVQASTFFIVPLYLTVVLGLTAFATGVRLVPLSVSLLIVAIAVPKFRPQANPRRVVRIGLLMLAAGALVLVAGIDPGADASVVTIPMILLGCGMGALASQLGAVTVSAVPDERSAEVGGVQNTATNLGASLGTALIGSILIGSLTVAFITNIQNNPAVPPEVSAQASTQLASGVPFVSEADLTVALNNAGVPAETATAIVQEYNDASLAALRTSMAFVAFFAIIALFFSGRIPNKAIGVSEGASASPG